MATTMTVSRRTRLAAGVALFSVGLAAAAAVSAPAVAQEAATEALEIEASTLYVSPVSDAIPPTVRKQVPPEAVCVVRPELCPESSEPLRNAAVDVLATVNENEPVPPVQPVPPDTGAVSLFGGHTRYQTAVRFELPDLPAGQEVTGFTVTVPQAQPSYEVTSPAFRRAVLAVFEAIGPQDPAILAEGLVAALQEDPVEVDPELIGIEACPLLSEFEPGGPPQASSDREIPSRKEGGQRVPDVDCIFGANGLRQGDTWTFDLTFAAAAWASGELRNHGLLLRPIGAPNLAFGDPDTSTTAQVALDLTEVRAAVTTAEPAPPVDGLPDLPAVEDAGLEDDAAFDDGGFDDGGFGDDGFGGGVDDGGVAHQPPVDAGAGFEEAPDVAGPELAEEDLGTPGAAPAPQAAPPGVDALTAGETGPVNPWWLWLLVPAFAGGAYLVTQALTAPVPAGTAASAGGGGALSRLVARRAGGASPPMNQV